MSILLNKFFGTNFKKGSIFICISYHSPVHISAHGQKNYCFKQSFTSKYYLVEQFQYLAYNLYLFVSDYDKQQQTC